MKDTGVREAPVPIPYQVSRRLYDSGLGGKIEGSAYVEVDEVGVLKLLKWGWEI